MTNIYAIIDYFNNDYNKYSFKLTEYFNIKPVFEVTFFMYYHLMNGKCINCNKSKLSVGIFYLEYNKEIISFYICREHLKLLYETIKYEKIQFRSENLIEEDFI